MSEQTENNTLVLKLLPQDLFLFANPGILLLNGIGGKRAQAAEWFIEFQKDLKGIHFSLQGLEGMMNQIQFDQKVYVNETEILVNSLDRSYLCSYFLQNAISRIFSLLEKLSQIIRCHYENKSNGGKLSLPSKGQKKDIDEESCSFYNVIQVLRTEPRNKKIDTELFTVYRNQDIKDLKTYRKSFTHRRNKLDQSLGLTFEVLEVRETKDGGIETGFALPKVINFNEIRIKCANAYNVIIESFNNYNELIFPRDFIIKVDKIIIEKQST